MFTISIEASSLSALKSKVKEVLVELGEQDENLLGKSNESPVARDTKTTAKPSATKSKSSAKEKPTATKKAAEVDPFEETEVLEEAPPLKPIKISKELVIEALKEVNMKSGIEGARSVLSEFGVQRLSELKDSDYAKFVDSCKAAL